MTSIACLFILGSSPLPEVSSRVKGLFFFIRIEDLRIVEVVQILQGKFVIWGFVNKIDLKLVL